MRTRLSSAVRRAAVSGFTLLEITVAMLIFFLIVTFAFWAMSDSVDQALSAEHARQLRMLAERKLSEIAVFEQHFDDNFSATYFDDLPDDLRDQFEGWTWELEVRDVTVFGTQKDENAPYLFSENDPGAAEESGTGTTGGTTGGTSGGSARKGETQLLRELVLRVASPAGEDGGEGDAIEVVTYLPQVAAKAAPSGTGAAGNGGR